MHLIGPAYLTAGPFGAPKGTHKKQDAVIKKGHRRVVALTKPQHKIKSKKRNTPPFPAGCPE